MKSITLDEFIEKYEPIDNPYQKEAPFEGKMFETYGKELEEVENYGDKYIWTVIDGDYETEWIIPGFHRVNREGYFITLVPWEDDILEVNLNDMISVGEAKYTCMDFLVDELNIPLEQFEDKIHDYFLSKF